MDIHPLVHSRMNGLNLFIVFKLTMMVFNNISIGLR